MKTTLHFTKTFTKGNLAGITINDSLPFVSVERAEIWRKAVTTKSAKLGYRIVDFSYQSYFRD